MLKQLNEHIKTVKTRELNKNMQNISPEALQDILNRAQQEGLDAGYLSALALMLSASNPEALIAEDARESVAAQFLQPIEDDLELFYDEDDAQSTKFYNDAFSILIMDHYPNVNKLLRQIQQMQTYIASFQPKTTEQIAVYDRVKKAITNLAEVAPVIFIQHQESHTTS